MHIKPMDNSQWPAIQEIYKEAFPKSEQKPFFLLKRPVRSGKAQLWTAEEDGQLLGFLLANIWKDLVLVDYLAVSSKSRGKGTGSQLLQHVVEIGGGQMEVLRWPGHRRRIPWHPASRHGQIALPALPYPSAARCDLKTFILLARANAWANFLSESRTERILRF